MPRLDAHGMHALVPESEYRAHPAINYSHLKHGEQSAQHMKASIDGVLKPLGSSADVGSCVHALILQPERFDDLIAVEPTGIDRRTTVGKEKYAEFLKSSVGKIMVDAAQVEVAKRMAANVHAHPAARELLERGGASELTLRWAVGDVECKARIDFLADGAPPTLIDIKTTADASPAEFGRSVARFGYHLQAAWYASGWAALNGGEIPEVRIIAVENTPPYAVAVYELDEETLGIGRALIGDLLAMYAACRSAGVWPGYGDEVLTTGIPLWARKRFEEDPR